VSGSRQSFPDFQIIPIRLDDSTPPPELAVHKWIDLQSGELTPGIAAQLLETLHGGESDPKNIGLREVYMACGSRPNEVAVRSRVAQKLRELGLRSVRDAPDQYHFDESRIKPIIMGCGALVAVVSHRGEGRTSPYISREVSLARKIGVPVLAITEEGVEPEDFASAGALVRVTRPFTGDIAARLDEILEEFADEVGDPLHPAYAFFGHSFDRAEAEIWSCVRRAVQAVAGIPCVSGDEIAGGDVQQQIIQRIQKATVCLFDITADRLNSCIEAGIALGAPTPFELVCRAPRRRPPFLFRDRQVWFYESTTELIGLVRKLMLPFRRVVN
jgi:hypothetical protein